MVRAAAVAAAGDSGGAACSRPSTARPHSPRSTWTGLVTGASARNLPAAPKGSSPRPHGWPWSRMRAISCTWKDPAKSTITSSPGSAGADPALPRCVSWL